MDEHARDRQKRFRQRRKRGGYLRVDVWVPPDLVAAFDPLYRPEAGYCCPAQLLVTLSRRALRLSQPPRDRKNTTP